MKNLTKIIFIDLFLALFDVFLLFAYMFVTLKPSGGSYVSNVWVFIGIQVLMLNIWNYILVKSQDKLLIMAWSSVLLFLLNAIFCSIFY
jgi:hypothetical protein